MGQRFGERPEFYAPLGYPLGHHGIDWPGYGFTVYAMADGELVFSGYSDRWPGRGAFLIIEHEWPWETHYYHFEYYMMGWGRKVKRGERIGEAGYSGLVDPPGKAGAHLHAGLRDRRISEDDVSRNRGFVDPETFLLVTA